MITIKNEQDIKHLKCAGKILASVLELVIKQVRPGVTTAELDDLAEKLILDAGCEPSFKEFSERGGVAKFPTTLCVSVNNEVVHTPASGRVIESGDIMGIDVGLKYNVDGKNYFVDMAKTVPVGNINRLAKKLIRVTEKSLMLGISQIKPGNYISDISRAVQEYAESQGFSVVRQLVGHGVGFAVHEPPRIPNYVEPGALEIELKAGMVLAIEPMVNVGGWQIKTLDDGWTVVTADGSLSAHFEHTVVVTTSGHLVLTN